MTIQKNILTINFIDKVIGDIIGVKELISSVLETWNKLQCKRK